MGKTVIVARDGPGFLVNRCGRPFGGEALRLLQERVASVEQIDRIVRLGGGLPHGSVRADGPGGDRRGLRGGAVVHGAELRRATLEAEHAPGADGGSGPSGPQDAAAAGTRYEDGPHRPDDPEPPAPAAAMAAWWPSPGRVLWPRAARAGACRGFDVRDPGDGEPEPIVDAAVPAPGDLSALGSAPGAPLAARDLRRPQSGGALAPGACGFHLLPPVADTRLVELTRVPSTRRRRGRGRRALLHRPRSRARVGGGRARPRARGGSSARW